MLYERHQAYKGFAALGTNVLAEAKRQGLVVPRWQGPGSAQYADQKTSAGRLALIARAAALDPELAYASCSMGLFQVMGSNHKAAGYDSAVEMHHGLTMGGIEAHIACGVAFMRTNGLLRHLAARNWASFAKDYNGKQFKKNAYDTKLASAYAEWTTMLRASPAQTVAAVVADASTLKLGDRGPRVRALQESLAAFGTPVKADSIYGPATRASLQRVHGRGDRPHVVGMRRYELTDAQWEQIAPLLPPQKPRTGRPAEDHRQVLNGMLWILRTGAPWADLPARYGAVGTVSSRFYRWRQAGVFDRVLRCLQAQADARGDLDWDLHFVDATVVRAHQHAAGARRSGAIGG